MQKKNVKDIDLNGKTVIMRVDFNVPLNDELEVTDSTRIKATLPTINYILNQNAKLILMSHLGRPKGKVIEKLRMMPIATELSKQLQKKVLTTLDSVGKHVQETILQMEQGEILLLENLRFHREEEKNDLGFAKQLADLADIYVNDAFGTAHRAHASTEGITHYLPAVSGFLIEKELKYLGQALANPKRPFTAIVGGAKVSTKITVLENLLDQVDNLIIGGGMSYTFCKAQGHTVGNSLLEKKYIDTAKTIINKAKEKGVNLVIPNDHIVADAFSNDAAIQIVQNDIPDGFMGMDVGPESLQQIIDLLVQSQTILMNGPVGVFEMDNFAKGTNEIAKILGNIDAITVVGGGDSVSAINKNGVADKITHLSTGGGASVEFIEGKKLPGIEALNNY